MVADAGGYLGVMSGIVNKAESLVYQGGQLFTRRNSDRVEEI